MKQKSQLGKNNPAYYTQKLISKEPFKSEDVNSLLKAHHAVYAGSTSKDYGKYMTDKGVLSYEILAETIKIQQNPTRIVDLACGDGILSEIIAKKFPNQVKILS